MATASDLYPPPSFRDWLLLVIFACSFLSGIVLVAVAPNDPKNVVLVVLGGLPLAFCAYRVVRKLRRRRQRPPPPAGLAGGVLIRPSRVRIYGAIATLIAAGMVIAMFADNLSGLPLQPIGWLLTVIGLVCLASYVSGRIPVGYLEFNPRGITISSGFSSYMIPWDNISGMQVRERNSRQLLLIWLHRLEAVEFDRLEYAPRMIKFMKMSASTLGAPAIIHGSYYDLDLAPLAKSLERYVRHPAARAELARHA
jgi:hypothetical protein